MLFYRIHYLIPYTPYTHRQKEFMYLKFVNLINCRIHLFSVNLTKHISIHQAWFQIQNNFKTKPVSNKV